MKIRYGIFAENVYEGEKKEKKINLKEKINTRQDITFTIVTMMWVRIQTNYCLFPTCNRRLLTVSVSRVTTPVPQGGTHAAV